MDQEDSKSNIGALAIGFFLIVAVVSIFFLKPYIFSKKPVADVAEVEKLPEISYASVSVDDLNQKKSKEKITIIDIRGPELFATEHIIDSRSIPAESFSSEMERLSKDHQYILVDESGLTPDQKEILNIMRENDFEKVAYLEGGFTRWKEQLRPTVTAGDPYSFTDQSKVTYIKSDELKETVSKEKNIYLIDLRKEDEYRSGHMPNAVNIRLADLESRRDELPFGKKIILYDNDGLWAFQGAVRLFDMGIFNVYSLSDGFKAWQSKGFEIAK